MKTIIQDTADVVMRRKSDGMVIFESEAQLASISAEVETNEIRGGLGNKLVALLKSNKSVNLTVRSALFNPDYLSMTQGVSFQDDTVTVWHKEDSEITDNAGSQEVSITGTIATGGDVKVYDREGAELGATNTGGVITVTQGAVGDEVTVLYQKEATGSVLNIDADKFSEAYEIEYHTIEYSPETNRVVKDLYIQFNNVTPSDAFELSFENGTAITPEFNFSAKAPVGSSNIGKIIEVERTA